MTRLVIAATVATCALLLVPAPALAGWNWPLRGEVVTAFRNGDDPYAAGQHRGIDVAGQIGARVVAAVPGLVRFAGTAGSSGSTVSVRSEDGRFDVSYLHLGSIAVRRGARVAAGDAIGTVGTTGLRSIDRPHLHFGVREAGTRHAYIDPLTLLPPLAAPAPRPPQAAPVAAPAPVRPAPAPVPVPRSPVIRAPRPAGRWLPAPAPGPAPVSARHVHPAGAGREVPAPRVAWPGPAPAGPAHAAPQRRPAAPGARLGTIPAGADAGHARQTVHRQPAGSRRGPDIGWLAACAGMLAAALALSTGTGDRFAGAAAVPRARLAALLPALAGRGSRTRE